jgi:hypothetical protein
MSMFDTITFLLILISTGISIFSKGIFSHLSLLVSLALAAVLYFR